MPKEHPDFPAEDLRAALPDDPDVYKRISELHDELHAHHPKSAAIQEHVSALRQHPSLRDIITAWFDDPRTQAFIAELTAAGL